MKPAVFDGNKISQQLAKEHLNELIKLYKKGHEKIVLFYPDFDMRTSVINDLDFDEFQKIIDKAHKEV